MKKLRLIIDVDYELNGADDKSLKQLLEEVPAHAAKWGLFSGASEAEVTGWSSKILDMDPVWDLDLENPEHAKAFFTAANDHLAEFAERFTAQELHDAMANNEYEDPNSPGDYNWTVWEPHENKPTSAILENITCLALCIINQERK